MKYWRIFILLIFISCQDNEADAPEMFTEDAQAIGSTGVLMGAEIKKIGPVRPVNFGFLWDTQENISMATAANKYIGGSTSDARKFSIQLSNLYSSTKYYYRGFAANADYSKIYYGNIIAFTTLP